MKIAMFTDLHVGGRGNSTQHLEDCNDYIDWFIGNVKKHKCDALHFGGDFYEQRNAINIASLNVGFNIVRKINALNLPIYFCIGNHDLYHRENRNEISTYKFSEFKNITLINDPFILKDMMFFPYIFAHEYPAAAALIVKHKPRYVFGHFEFKGFIVTGSTDKKIEHGLDHSLFTGPEYVFSGHFHKRQALDNVVYIGNCFPLNYGDVGDDERGMAILDTSDSSVDFIDWEESPKFRKVRLSDVLVDSSLSFPEKCRVKCIIDTEMGYSDAQALREELISKYNLREFLLEENIIEKKELIAGEENLKDVFEFSSINDAVVSMLESGIEGTTINPKMLVNIYNTL